MYLLRGSLTGGWGIIEEVDVGLYVKYHYKTLKHRQMKLGQPFIISDENTI